jgi:2-methylisocitrate lyase-like PEP mutase family enzyme
MCNRADWTFLEAPESELEMRRYCNEVEGPKLANMLEFGSTPVLSPPVLTDIGFTVAAYPLTLLSASVKAMLQCLQLLKSGRSTEDMIISFTDLKHIVGFNQYDLEMNKLSDFEMGRGNENGSLHRYEI